MMIALCNKVHSYNCMSLTIIWLATACMPQADTFSNLNRQNKSVEESGTSHIEKTRLYDLVTRLWQGCNIIVYNEQGGDKVVTRWWQDCDNTIYYAHGGDKVVTRLFPTSKVMTRLSQPCDKVVQHTHNLVKDTMNSDIWVWARLHIQN